MAKKRILTTLCVLALALALVAGLFACANIPLTNAKTSKTQAKKVYAFSAMTSASMMSEAFGAAAPNAAEVSVSELLAAEAGTDAADGTAGGTENAGDTANGRPEAVEGDLEELNRYMKMFEGYLLNNGVNETVSAPTEADGEYAGYTYKVTMEVPNLKGESESYVLYYTEYNQETSEKLDYEDDDDDEDEVKSETKNADADDDDEADAEEGSAKSEQKNADNETETEVSTRLEGVMIYGGTAYPVEGEKNLETEGDETEAEILFTTRLADGDNQNYIEVKQSTENETGEQEASYEYKIVKDGNTVSKTKIEIETDTEENEQEVNLVFFDASGATPSKTKYSFERETAADGTAEIVIKYNTTGEPAGVIRVRANQDGTYTFLYENGYEEDLD